MNLFNGVLVAIGALASVAVGVLILLLATETIPVETLPGAALRQQFAGVAEHSGGAFWQDVGIAIGFIAIGLIILALEGRMLTRGGAAGMVLVSAGPEGVVRMSMDSIAQLAQRTARGNRDVRNIRCTVRAAPGGLTIRCVAGLRMGADVPEVSSDVQQNIQVVVERLTGLPVTDVPIRVRYEGDRDQPVLTR